MYQPAVVTTNSRDRLVGRDVLGGQYRVRQRLGSGGFGAVYQVETVVGGLRRALKVLHPHWASDEAARQRFVNEAIVLEQINHPNVARCFSVGELEPGGDLYLLFEFVDGVPLSEAMREDSGQPVPMSPLRAVRIAHQVAAGLTAAHARQVLHRDLKPENVLVGSDGRAGDAVKIVDFGIARSIGEAAATSHDVLGTPAYLAPDQILSPSDLDARVDLWQLGALLYFMLTGEAPYSLEQGIAGLPAQHARHLDEGPRPGQASSSRPILLPLDRLVGRLLATDRDRRPKSAAEVCVELARIAHHLSPGGESNPLALLEALAASPGEDSWWAVCRYLLDLPEAERTRHVSVAETLLDDWPDTSRRASITWWTSVRRGGTHPLWRLARSLDLKGQGLDDEDARELAGVAALESIRVLNLSGNQIGPVGAEALAASPHLGQLVDLDISHNRLSSSGVEALAQSSGLTGVTTLRLAGNGVGPSGAATLARSMLRLRHLDLSDNDLRSAGATALATGPALQDVEALWLSRNELGSDGVGAIAMSRTLGRLRLLDLAHNDVGRSGAAALALSPVLARLSTLCLGQNRLGLAGLELLASNRLAALESLDLSGNDLDAAGAMLLASSSSVRRLKHLCLADNALGDAGLAALLGAPHLSGLRVLDVARNGITSAGLALLSAAPSELEQVDVSGNALTDDGARALGTALAGTRVITVLAAQAGLTGSGVAAILASAGGRLQVLDVSRNPIGADGARAIGESPQLAAVRSLKVSACGLGMAGLAGLVEPGHLRGLRALGAGASGLSDEDAPRLLDVLQWLPELRYLDLSDNGLRGAFADGCQRSPLRSALSVLNLSDNRFSDAEAASVVSGAPWAVHTLDLSGNLLSIAGAATVSTAPALPLLAELNLARNPLKGAVDLHSLPSRTVALLESSFSVLAAEGADFAARFYRELFARHPSVAPLFSRVSMRHQQQHLMAALGMVIEHLRAPEQSTPLVADLGRRHVRYHVQASQYAAVTSVLLDVLRQTLGESCTPEIEEAWREGLEAIGTVMRQAHQESG